MAITAQGLVKLIDEFTNGLCEPSAIQLHIVTGKPIYAIYNPNDRVYWWGIDYWHHFIKLDEDRYLNARGIHTGEEMIAYWANAWGDASIADSAVIVEHTPILSGTGDYSVDRVLIEMYGDPTTIQPHTIQFADMLLRAHKLI